MNKKLIALAIAGAFAAPVAMADTGGVTIYGEFAGSVDSVDGGSYSATSTATPKTGGLNAATSERRSRVSSNNSFIGFKGSEDLGNGQSAIWQYEQGIAIDKQNINNNAADTNPDLTSAQSRRNTFVGLAGKQWGTLTLGVQDSPLKTSTGPLDAFGQHTIADYRNIWGAIGSPTGSQNIASNRMQNSVLYVSPNMSGFTVKAMYAAQNEAGNNTATTSVTNPHYYSVGGLYANGPLFATLAYEDNKTVPNVTPGVSDFTFKNWRAGVGYTFGDLKIGLGYERIKGDGNTTGATAVHDLSRGAWYLPVSYTMGSNVFKLAYTKAGKSNQKNAAGTDLSGSDGANQWSIGMDHNMSKRTKVYALYTQVRNDSNGMYSLGGAGSGIAQVSPASVGADPRGLSVGMVTTF